jgi:hypothetical protein
VFSKNNILPKRRNVDESIINENNNYADGKEGAYIEKIEQFADIIWLSGAGSYMTFFDFSVYTGG